MPDLLERRIVEIVQDALRTTSGDGDLIVGSDASMETHTAWDSLTFMTVFIAINEAFGLTPDFDDAIHYMAVPSIVGYVRQQTS